MANYVLLTLFSMFLVVVSTCSSKNKISSSTMNGYNRSFSFLEEVSSFTVLPRLTYRYKILVRQISVDLNNSTAQCCQALSTPTFFCATVPLTDGSSAHSLIMYLIPSAYSSTSQGSETITFLYIPLLWLMLLLGCCMYLIGTFYFSYLFAACLGESVDGLSAVRRTIKTRGKEIFTSSKPCTDANACNLIYIPLFSRTQNNSKD